MSANASQVVSAPLHLRFSSVFEVHLDLIQGLLLVLC
jgi:hypothetical protein